MLRCKCRKRTPPNAWIKTQHAMKETTPRTLRDSFARITKSRGKRGATSALAGFFSSCCPSSFTTGTTNEGEKVLGKECQAGPDSFDGALTTCVAPSDARTIEDATEEKRQWEVFGGQDREGVSVESDPDPPSPPGGQRCSQTVRRERGQEVARDDQELLRVLGRCIEDLPSLCGMLEVRLENVQHGGGKGPG